MSTALETQRTQHLSFTVAGEEYAVPLLRVKELVQYSPVTRVPASAPAVRGVVSLRGRVVPVVDLALQFGLAETPITRFTCLVMLDVEEQVVGVMADTVNDVLELAGHEVEPPPAFGGTAEAGFLVGLGKPGGRLVMLLDVTRVLSAAAAGEVLARTTPAPAPSPPSSSAAMPSASASPAAAASTGPSSAESSSTGLPSDAPSTTASSSAVASSADVSSAAPSSPATSSAAVPLAGGSSGGVSSAGWPPAASSTSASSAGSVLSTSSASAAPAGASATGSPGEAEQTASGTAALSSPAPAADDLSAAEPKAPSDAPGEEVPSAADPSPDGGDES